MPQIRNSGRPRWAPWLCAGLSSLALLACGLATAIASTPAHSTPPKHSKPARPKLHGNAGRAENAYQAMQSIFYLPSAGLYRGAPYSYLWAFSQALAATISMTAVPGADRSYHLQESTRLASLQAYWDPGPPPGYDGGVVPPRGSGGRKYYDDNDWIALELLRLYRHDHYTAFLTRAKQLYSLITSAWDVKPSDACPGGVPFSSDPRNDQRNVVTTAPAVELATELYALTGDADALAWAQRMYGWVRTCLMAPSGLYFDHISPSGQIDQTTWSYNQGTMIGAGVMLYQATGRSEYLDQARFTAGAALGLFTPARLHAEPPFFASVYFRNLLLLDGVRHDPAYRQVVQAYADWAFQQHRSARTGIYSFGAPGTMQLLDQAAMVNVYAFLATPGGSYF